MSAALQVFLYLLLRDEVPAGIVERLAIEAEKAAANEPVVFSNEHVAGYARELVDRLS